MSKVSILIASHKRSPILKTKVFQPIHVGRALASAETRETLSEYIGDDTGDNISHLNMNYAEVSAIYWAWKNISPDVTHVGLMHYSRYFNFGIREYKYPSNIFKDLSSETIAKYSFDDKSISNLCLEYDIICPEPWEMRREHIEYEHRRYKYLNETASKRIADAPDVLNLYDHYSLGHIQEDFDLALEIMQEKFPLIHESAQLSLKKCTARFTNMFVMRRDLFDDYCDYLFTIIECMKETKNFNTFEYTEGQFNSRVFGFLAERLFSIYLDYLEKSCVGLRILNKQVVFAQFPQNNVVDNNEKETDEINIVMSSDDNYASFLSVALTSIFQHNLTHQINVYVLDGGISKRNKRVLRNFVKKFNHSISFVEIDIARFNELCPMSEECKHITLPTYFRFALASLLPIDINRVLYLDVDIILNAPVHELYNIDLEDYFAAAVVDTYDLMKDHGSKLGIEGAGKYFNAGVMVINLQKWRSEDIENKFFTNIPIIGDNIAYQDQDVLNFTFKDRIKYLPIAWNLQQTAYFSTRSDLDDLDIKEAKDNPKLIHFSGHIKPWDMWFRSWHPYTESYLKYWKLSPHRGSYYKMKFRRLLTKFAHKTLKWRFEYFYIRMGKLQHMFDYSYYLECYPEVVSLHIDPLLHYLQVGWKESKNPSRNFNTSGYLNSNPDVAASGMNPFVHYLVYGMAENRVEEK